MRLRGSYTVEAALLMTVILPLLFGIIYLGFYLHNGAMMQNAAYELAVLESLQGEEMEERSVEERKQVITGQAFLNLKNVRAEVIREKKSITASLEGTFYIPGLVMRFWCQNRLKLSADAKLAVCEPGKTIARIHMLKKLIEEDGDGSNVSP